jgi:hypothetical protein
MKLYEELHSLYSSPSIIRMIDEMGRACSMHRENRNAWRVLVGKPKGKRPPGRPRHRWENNMKMDLREIGWVRRTFFLRS